ncbi:MAG TPA: phage portal protein, partial [Chitinophagaceae bacterium]|nr:phage portal protein [Chitinophagaceae bacterium]
FANEHVEGGKGYITADIARFGKDKTVVMIWNGWRVIDIVVMKHKKTTEVAQFILRQMRRYGIPKSQVVVDDDGVGGGVVDQVGCKGFVNNSSPLPNPKSQDDENYRNLKTQCSYMMAALVNEKGLYVECDDTEIREKLSEELEQVKKKDPDTDKKLEIVPKEVVKELLGRSPDYSDTLMMRQYFELKPKRRVLVA